MIDIVSQNPHFTTKKLIVGIGLILVLATVFVLGRYSNNKIDNIPNANNTGTSIVDDMSGWKTYSGNNISFQYPPDYTVEDKDDYISLISPLDPTPRKGYAISQKELKIEVVIFNSDSSDSLEKWGLEEKSITEGSIEEIGTTKIDGVEAKILKLTGVGIAKTHLIIHNDKRYMILKYPFETSRDAEFDQILSTFKFIEKTSETRNIIGYITDIENKNGQLYVSFDEAIWLVGEEAISTAIIETGCVRENIYNGECAPSLNNGFYISNIDTQSVLFKLSNSAIMGNNKTGEVLISSDNFRDVYTKSALYSINIKNSQVTQITAMYMP